MKPETKKALKSGAQMVAGWATVGVVCRLILTPVGFGVALVITGASLCAHIANVKNKEAPDV